MVPWKGLQIESGLLFANSKEEDHSISEFSYPSLLVRYGLLKKIELRMAGGFATIKQTYEDFSESKTEIGNLSLGVKLSLMQENGILPEIGLLGHLKFPLSADTLIRNKVRPNMILAFSHTLTQKFSLGYNLGWEAGYNNNNGNGLYSISVGYGINEKLGIFLESYGWLINMKDNSSIFDGGITWLIKDNMQVDLSSGFGLNSKTWFIGGGFSIRIPD